MKLLLFIFVVQALVALASAEEIPLRVKSTTHPYGWRLLAFKNSKANTLYTSNGSLLVAVNASSGPLVYSFGEVKTISGFTFQGTVDGLILLPALKNQGESGADDFVLRFGIILSGDKKMTRLQSMLAPVWVRELAVMGPKGTGLGKIDFYNVANGSGPIWKQRMHPSGNQMLKETIACSLQQPGEIFLDKAYSSPVRAVGLWIACDGDDTGSKFNLAIDRIEIRP
ncbi:MAG: hypothetical protein P1V20_06680 [Verrucomicrobiales bacterium]|nr:hypothetical protein [Verrucomicrobiales bacterium]